VTGTLKKTYDAVICDYGNTLVWYYTRDQWPAIREECIAEVAAYLNSKGLFEGDAGSLAERVRSEERIDSGEHRVVPLEERLVRIFSLERAALEADVAPAMCRLFMQPIFALARRHDDVLPTLNSLRERGLRTGILSNTPWGSPSILWREELDRHRLLSAVDAAVFCCDCGWRKPARQPFDLILEKLGVNADRSLFVGDDPRWDIAGPRAIGMEAVLIDRTGKNADAIHGLRELLDRL